MSKLASILKTKQTRSVSLHAWQMCINMYTCVIKDIRVQCMHHFLWSRVSGDLFA